MFYQEQSSHNIQELLFLIHKVVIFEIPPISSEWVRNIQKCIRIISTEVRFNVNLLSFI